jgi:hypothetical protein
LDHGAHGVDVGVCDGALAVLRLRKIRVRETNGLSVDRASSRESSGFDTPDSL